MYLKFLFALLTILLYNVQPISNDESLVTAIQILQQRDGSIIPTLDRCRIDNFDRNMDWLMSYYNNFQRSKNDLYQIHRLPPCSKLTQFTISTRIQRRYQRYINQMNKFLRNWSTANIDLIQAITKVIILVILKIFIKYYIQSYIHFYIQNESINELIDLLSKAMTIAIAKIAIKHSFYPALRTAMKTLLIAGLKTLIKPWMKKIKNKNEKIQTSVLLNKIIRFALTIQIKTIIKTIALHLLWLVFEKNDNQFNRLPGLMFRVAVIIMVKMAAKRTCKMAKKKKNKTDNMDGQTLPPPPPVDQVLLFAIQKLVTKLIKIPLIKIMFD